MADRRVAAASRREGPLSDALRANVRMLTTMLGDAIAESGGPELLGQVEALRKATIAYRGRPTDARRRRVTDLVASFDLDRAEDVIRAFTCYFQLVNLAEERHRVRTLRERSRSGKPVERLDRRARRRIRRPVRDLRITPVLTAHPTEAKRRAVVEHLWRIGVAAGAARGPVARDLRGAGGRAPDARGDRGPVAHGPDPPAPARAARRGARGARAVRPDDLHDAPGDLPGDGQHARPGRLRHAAAVVRTVPAMGHLGRAAIATATRA